ncbi:unnamed protein product [Malus baccata var. baccata]
MAMNHDQHQNPQSHSVLLDALLCEEEKWEEEDDGEVIKNPNYPSLFPIILLEQDLFWEDDEHVYLFSKKEQQQTCFDSLISAAHCDAVMWMLKVNTHYRFITLTVILALWMVQLVAVTCLSLAAKVEETEVPLLLDLQLSSGGCIQSCHFSFLDHIIRRFGLKTHLHWEFLKRCERLFLSVPSSLATCDTSSRVLLYVEHCLVLSTENTFPSLKLHLSPSLSLSLNMALATQPTTNLFQNPFISSKPQPRPQLPTGVPCLARRRSGSIHGSIAVAPTAIAKASKKYKVKSVKAKQIIDSRSNPTVEVDLVIDDLYRSTVPNDAFNEIYEVLELKYGDKAVYGGKGVLTAVKNIN